MTIQQKFARASIALQQIRPFYASVFQVIEKLPDEQVPDMVVTENRILYNPDYVERLDMERFLYLVIHMVAHIALRHVPRRQGRDAALWNAAADLYVNRLLGEEFWIAGPGRATSIHGSPDRVMMPDDALFSAGIDIEKDSVEAIYSSLSTQAANNGYREAEQSGEDSDSVFRCSGDGGVRQGVSGRKEPDKISLSPKMRLDLKDSGEDPAQAAMMANKVMSDALMRLELTGHSAGNANCRLRVMAEKLHHANTNWRSLLQRYLRGTASRDSSWKRPDKRMLWQKAIYPNPAGDEDAKLKDLKICIDISGSVSDSLVEDFYGQVCSLTKRFGVDAELIFWDVAVQEKCIFTRFSDLRKLQPYGRGGTDPGCLFRYFDSPACDKKPFLTLVFTDGDFTSNWDDSKWHKRYKNTAWVLTGKFYHRFHPPFGKKAILY